MRFRHMLAAAVFAAVSCLAADADGKWAGNIVTPRGDIPMKFDLKVADGKVTGTAVGPQGEVPVSNGIYEEGKVAFQLRYRVYDQTMVFHYEGKVVEDEMQMKLMFGVNEPVSFVVKRQK